MFESLQERLGSILNGLTGRGALSEADVSAALREVRRESRDVILDAQAARREAANLLQQPTLDSNALAAALERARNADVTVRARLEQRIVEFAASGSPDDRQLLADALLRRAGRQPPPAKKSP
ncbi:periplasmic heavy metal sensor [Mesorhizobium sp. M2A.F.Ca.ET.040.01.1.1]|nr:periplasmic heavy metal sensor [Mesorhizobium sp. M2A.F.Ca.ET.040.01.1.1]